jgi:hypothetical protein
MRGIDIGVRRWAPLAAFAAALLLASAAVAATAPTRDEYVGQLEAICKPSAEATQRAMKGARTDIRAERLKVAAGKFGQAATIFAGSVKKTEAVPRPAADSAKLAKWFGYLDDQESYLREAAAQLRAENAVQAQRLTARFIHSGNLANNTVLAFGFQYCTFKFSRYG